ncbi:class I lanthipeptide [Ascidiimonas sp. W6]
MKNKKKQLGKLTLKKSTIAGLDSNFLTGGTGTS